MHAEGIFQKLKNFVAPGGEKKEETTTNTTAEQEKVTEGVFENIDLGKLGEKATKTMPESDQKRLEEHMKQGKFDMEDFRIQLESSLKMSKLGGAAKYIPGLSKYKEQIGEMNTELEGFIKIIATMSPEQKQAPEKLLKQAFKEKSKLAESSGKSLQDVNRLLERYFKTKEVMDSLYQKQQKGEPIPSTPKEMMAFLSQQTGVKL